MINLKKIELNFHLQIYHFSIIKQLKDEKIEQQKNAFKNQKRKKETGTKGQKSQTQQK